MVKFFGLVRHRVYLKDSPTKRPSKNADGKNVERKNAEWDKTSIEKKTPTGTKGRR
jgi:hypothetical protein